MAEVVLDASAALAFIKGEPGAENVLPYIGEAAMSAVNLQEVIVNLLRDGLEPSAIREIVSELRLEIMAHDEEAAHASAALLPHTARHGRGLGDRSCMALAISLGIPALTADREWTSVIVDGLSVTQVR